MEGKKEKIWQAAAKILWALSAEHENFRSVKSVSKIFKAFNITLAFCNYLMAKNLIIPCGRESKAAVYKLNSELYRKLNLIPEEEEAKKIVSKYQTSVAQCGPATAQKITSARPKAIKPNSPKTDNDTLRPLADFNRNFPGLPKFIILLLDYDNFNSNLTAAVKDFNAAEIMHKVRKLGKISLAVLFVDSAQLTPERRVEIFSAGMLIVDCPKIDFSNGHHKDTVDPIIIKFSQWIGNYCQDIDAVILGTQDHDFLACMNQLKDFGKEVMLLCPIKQKRTLVFQKADRVVALYDHAANNLDLILVEFKLSAFDHPDPELNRFIGLMAQIVKILDARLKINENQYSFHYIKDFLLGEQDFPREIISERELHKILEFFISPASADVLIKCKHKAHTYYHLNKNHPFFHWSLNRP